MISTAFDLVHWCAQNAQNAPFSIERSRFDSTDLDDVVAPAERQLPQVTHVVVERRDAETPRARRVVGRERLQVTDGESGEEDVQVLLQGDRGRHCKRCACVQVKTTKKNAASVNPGLKGDPFQGRRQALRVCAGQRVSCRGKRC